MRKALLIVFTVIILAAVAFSTLPRGEKDGNKVMIGAPDGSGGLLVHYLVNGIGYNGMAVKEEFETYTIKDCCSSTSQWALSTGLLDASVMCPDSAQKLLEKDKRFEVLSECLVNSDIVVLKRGVTPATIGVAQNRPRQEQLIKDIFGPECRVMPMLPTAIPYAYEKNSVDGVVVDALRGLTMEGEIISPSAGREDWTTYVLVARKSFREDPRFNEFILSFKQAAEELNRPDVLQAAAAKYNGMVISCKEMDKWNQLMIRFLFTTQETPG